MDQADCVLALGEERQATGQGSAVATRAALVMLLVVLSLSSAHAQNAEEEETSPSTLDPIVVEDEGETATGPVDGYVASRSASGTKTDTPLIETPQSISVVTRDDMDARGVRDVGQALSYTGGVQTKIFGTDARYEGGMIRGFDVDQSYYLNSLKILRRLSAPSIEQYGLQRVEAVRGPASVLYGQSSPGGLINMISKRPVWEPLREVQLEAGSFDRYQGAFDLGGALNESKSLAYRLTGVVRNSDTQVDHVEDDRYFIAPAVTWRPDEDTRLTLLGSLQHDRAGSPVGLPLSGTLDSNPHGKLSTGTYLGEPDFDKSESTMANIGYEFEHRFNDSLEFRQNARYTYFNFDYQNLYLAGLQADQRTLNRGSSIQREKLNTVNVDNQLNADLTTGAVAHDLLVGIDVRHYWDRTKTGFGAAPPIDIFDPQYGQHVDEPAITADSSQVLTQVGTYVQDELTYENWHLVLGGRYDVNRQQSDNNLNDTTSEQEDSAFTGRAGLLYRFDSGLAPYVSYSTSFDPVIGTTAPQRGGDAFEPTEGEQYEAGLKYQPDDTNLFLTATVFDLTQTNVTTPDPDYSGFQVQTGEINVRGLELEGKGSLAEGLDLTTSYTYYDGEITSDNSGNEGNRPANVPKHSASAWLDYTFQEDQRLNGLSLGGLGLGGGVRYIGERYGDDANQIELDDVTLFDAAIHYEMEQWRASLNVNNLTDKTYLSSCSAFGCYFGDRRTFLAQLSFRW